MTKEQIIGEIFLLTSEMEKLKILKDNLVDSENYEEAAELRDYLNWISKKIEQYSILIDTVD